MMWKANRRLSRSVEVYPSNLEKTKVRIKKGSYFRLQDNELSFFENNNLRKLLLRKSNLKEIKMYSEQI